MIGSASIASATATQPRDVQVCTVKLWQTAERQECQRMLTPFGITYRYFVSFGFEEG